MKQNASPNNFYSPSTLSFHRIDCLKFWPVVLNTWSIHKTLSPPETFNNSQFKVWSHFLTLVSRSRILERRDRCITFFMPRKAWRCQMQQYPIDKLWLDNVGFFDLENGLATIFQKGLSPSSIKPCLFLFEWKPSWRKEVGIPSGILPLVWEQNKCSYFPKPVQS